MVWAAAQYPHGAGLCLQTVSALGLLRVRGLTAQCQESMVWAGKLYTPDSEPMLGHVSPLRLLELHRTGQTPPLVGWRHSLAGRSTIALLASVHGIGARIVDISDAQVGGLNRAVLNEPKKFGLKKGLFSLKNTSKRIDRSQRFRPMLGLQMQGCAAVAQLALPSSYSSTAFVRFDTPTFSSARLVAWTDSLPALSSDGGLSSLHSASMYTDDPALLFCSHIHRSQNSL